MKTEKETESYYEAKIWISNKLIISFWYSERLFDDIYDDIKKCLTGGRKEFWLGNYNNLEIHLTDWNGNHYYSESGNVNLSIPWDKVVMWNLTASELKNQPIKN